LSTRTPAPVRFACTLRWLANPLDWMFVPSAELAEIGAYTSPSAFGHDFAGIVDEAIGLAEHASRRCAVEGRHRSPIGRPRADHRGDPRRSADGSYRGDVPDQQVRDAVTLQAGRHVQGKVVITL
jgi:hypothetical protein